MTKAFSSFAGMATELAKNAGLVYASQQEGLRRIGVAVEKDAKDQIGIYQQAAGPFPAWSPLADSTEAEKERLGYPADAPLLRDGTLHGSIGHEVHAFEVVVGSTDPVAVYQELGTPTIPPRPFLGPAAIHQDKLIREVALKATIAGILGGAAMDRSLGYERETGRLLP